MKIICFCGKEFDLGESSLIVLPNHTDKDENVCRGSFIVANGDQNIVNLSAVMTNDIDETTKTAIDFKDLKRGEWTTLEELDKGAIFETRDNVLAIKTVYKKDDKPETQFDCFLVPDGAYAYFENKNKTEVREVFLSTNELATVFIIDDAKELPKSEWKSIKDLSISYIFETKDGAIVFQTKYSGIHKYLLISDGSHQEYGSHITLDEKLNIKELHILEDQKEK